MRVQQQGAFFLETNQLSWWVPMVPNLPRLPHATDTSHCSLPPGEEAWRLHALPARKPAWHSAAQPRSCAALPPQLCPGNSSEELLPAAATFYGPWPQDNIATAAPTLLNVPRNQTACVCSWKGPFAILSPGSAEGSECCCLATSGDLWGQPLTTMQRRDRGRVLPKSLECRALGFILLARRWVTTSVSETGMLTASVLSIPAFLCSSCHNLILGNVFFSPKSPSTGSLCPSVVSRADGASPGSTDGGIKHGEPGIVTSGAHTLPKMVSPPP